MNANLVIKNTGKFVEVMTVKVEIADIGYVNQKQYNITASREYNNTIYNNNTRNNIIRSA